VAGKAEFLIPSDAATQRLVGQAIQSVVHRAPNWIAIYPGAIWPTAVWPLDRFTAIVKHLYETYQMQSVVLWRNEHEKLVAKVIVEQAQSAAVLSPELDLREMVEACRQATFVVTGDSDILQIVSSVGTPSISLHGPTWADEFGGYNNGNYAIQSPFPLVGRRRFRKGANSAMLAIEYDEVQSYAERLIRDLELKARAVA
jgi:ADP-heptose:LPS heptosyltransferase